MKRYSIPLLLLSSSSVFPFTANHQPPGAHRISSFLHSAAAPFLDDESVWMQRARECANSESCSLEDAWTSLDRVIRIQSDCSSGALTGSRVCNDVDVAADIVAHLRDKIKRESKRLGTVRAGWTLVNVSLALLLLVISLTSMDHGNPAATPLTMQEWVWSIQGGYFPLMLKEYYQNGGFATADSYNSGVTAFTVQELGYAVRGGYLDQVVMHLSRDGGMAGVSNTDPSSLWMASSVVPFTPHEWTHAAQGGYLDRMIFETVQQGGLLSVDANVDRALPITPQEWVWAAKGNYLYTLASSHFEKGGL